MNKGRRWWLLGVFLFSGVAWAAGTLLIPVNSKPAPDFELQALAGGKRSLADYKDRIVVLNFWGSWCPPCRAEMPALQHLYEQTREQGVVVVAIAVADDPQAAEAFMQQHGLDFPVLFDTDGSVAQQWNAKVLPSTYILDRAQRIRYRATGERAWDAPEVIAQILGIDAK